MEFYTYCVCMHTCTWYVCATVLVCGAERTVLWRWCSFFYRFKWDPCEFRSYPLNHLINPENGCNGKFNRAEVPGASGAWVTSTWALHWPWVPSSGSKSEPAHTCTAFILSTKGNSPTVHRALPRISSKEASTAWFLVPCKVQCWALWAVFLPCFF